jgi:hypothetical protein
MSFTPKKITINWSPEADTSGKFQRLFDLLGLADDLFVEVADDLPKQGRAGDEQLRASPVKTRKPDPRTPRNTHFSTPYAQRISLGSYADSFKDRNKFIKTHELHTKKVILICSSEAEHPRKLVATIQAALRCYFLPKIKTPRRSALLSGSELLLSELISDRE